MGETILQGDVVNYYEREAVTPRTKLITITALAVSLIWAAVIGCAWGLYNCNAEDNIRDIVIQECADQIRLSVNP